MPITDPEPIRQALAARLQLVIPTLSWQAGARWTFQQDMEISGALRNFDIRFGPEDEVVVDDEGVQGAYGGGIEYAVDVEVRVSYPVLEAERDRFLGADARDLTALLETLHQFVSGMFAQQWSQRSRVASTWTGSPGAYVGSHRFRIRFFASDTVQVSP
jgi:hypothetical protein